MRLTVSFSFSFGLGFGFRGGPRLVGLGGKDLLHEAALGEARADTGARGQQCQCVVRRVCAEILCCARISTNASARGHLALNLGAHGMQEGGANVEAGGPLAATAAVH